MHDIHIEFDEESLVAIIENEKFSEKEMLDMLHEACELIKQTWVSAVTGSMVAGMDHPIHNETYAESIQITPPFKAGNGNYEQEVITTYERAEEIEEGHPAFDIKVGLLASEKTKRGKDGSTYITVPFKHTTTDEGENMLTGTHTSKVRGRAEFTSMPKDVYNDVKAGWEIRGDMRGIRSKVARQVDPSGVVMKGNYTWKAGLYDGMIRTTQHKDTGDVGKYLTFRRVSSNSDPDSWIYPAVAANKIRDAVMSRVAPQLDHIVDIVLRH